jgi:hypothetical protein
MGSPEYRMVVTRPMMLISNDVKMVLGAAFFGRGTRLMATPSSRLR